MAATLTPTPRFTGPAYPFGPDPAGTLGPKPDLNVVVTSIANIVTTPIGSLPYAPRSGSVVPLLLFDVNDEITKALVRYFTRKDLTEQEPRIVVQGVFTDEPDDHSIVVWVAFTIVGDPTGAVHSAPVTFPREGG